jgi:hypothetical protein
MPLQEQELEVSRGTATLGYAGFAVAETVGAPLAAPLCHRKESELN